MEYFTPAIVLNKSDVREHDRWFSLYTKNLGKIKVLARGVRHLKSKMAGHLEPFGLVAVKIVSGRGANHQLSNVETLRRCQNIIRDFELIKLAAGCLNLVDVLVREGSCDLGILALLEKILIILDTDEKSLAEKKFLVKVFQLQLVSHLGYRPELHSCIICKKKIAPANIYFDFLKGGLVCGECQDTAVRGSRFAVRSPEGAPSGFQMVKEDEVKILRLILEKDLAFFSGKKVAKVLADKVNNVIDKFVRVVRED